MDTEQPDYPTRITIGEDDSPTNTFISRNRCCFHFPCFTGGAAALSSSSTTSLWDRIEYDDRWWARPIQALKKLRQWSEIVAGPKWKTFIRRFNRHRIRHQPGNFQYDPLSYALNFDEGPGQNGQFDDDEYANFPDFTSRFVTAPLSGKADSGKDGGAAAG